MEDLDRLARLLELCSKHGVTEYADQKVKLAFAQQEPQWASNTPVEDSGTALDWTSAQFPDN